MGLRKNCEPNIKDRLSICRRIIKKTLLQSDNFRGHTEEKTHILDLLKRTVNMGESNSALIIGPRGCGKTTVIFKVL